MSYKRLNGVVWGNYPEGCGWFCRRLHDLKDIADTVVPAVSSRIQGILRAFEINPDNFSFKMAELSLQDQALLDDWYKQKFEPFTVNILNLFKSIETAKTSIEKVTIINEISSQLCLVSAYYQLPVIPFLTQRGKDEMNALIFEFSNSLLKEVAIELSKFKTVEQNQNLPFKIIAPIVTEPAKGFSEYKCFQYILTRIDNPVEETPVDVITPIETPIDTISTDLIDATEEVATKTKGLPWWVYVLGGIGIYKILK